MRLMNLTGKFRRPNKEDIFGEPYSKALVRCECGNEWMELQFARFAEDLICFRCGSTMIHPRSGVEHSFVSPGTLIVQEEKRVSPLVSSHAL